MLERIIARFRPFDCSAFIGKASSVALLQVRFNCPWHRTSYTPNLFPFNMKDKLNKVSVEKRSQTESGRQILMRRVLGEKHFIEWNWPSKKVRKERLSYPL